MVRWVLDHTTREKKKRKKWVRSLGPDPIDFGLKEMKKERRARGLIRWIKPHRVFVFENEDERKVKMKRGTTEH